MCYYVNKMGTFMETIICPLFPREIYEYIFKWNTSAYRVPAFLFTKYMVSLSSTHVMLTIYRSLCKELPTGDNQSKKHSDSNATSADMDTVFDLQYLLVDGGSGDCKVITDLSKYKCSLALYPVSKVL